MAITKLVVTLDEGCNGFISVGSTPNSGSPLEF